eukprot:CAMPEP_0185591362 /NCGR_PEP_ID=MMETSP0434-20130131/64202_1 /TAXON_ID=626734 ORGANISM="Favella taraikaensis, Strain Fe Narragansett Bay" /NCGR_SAMPLE_ID=MMETSP0434 /ASSEMBLY_ACC=CAM_ASM_000379 /LENGTH=103 /DNA_ID=CAMNT_0028216289 /DNA_START=759 /DNA_END=1070 /DNA_ORIENTATION=+
MTRQIDDLLDSAKKSKKKGLDGDSSIEEPSDFGGRDDVVELDEFEALFKVAPPVRDEQTTGAKDFKIKRKQADVASNLKVKVSGGLPPSESRAMAANSKIEAP